MTTLSSRRSVDIAMKKKNSPGTVLNMATNILAVWVRGGGPGPTPASAASCQRAIASIRTADYRHCLADYPRVEPILPYPTSYPPAVLAPGYKELQIEGPEIFRRAYCTVCVMSPFALLRVPVTSNSELVFIDFFSSL